MPGFYKIKYILLITMIFLLGGCGTTIHNITGNGNSVSQKPEIIKDTDEDKLKEAITFIQDKQYPQAIGLLSQIKDNKKAEVLLEQLRYTISGAYIANLGAGIAAIDNNGKVKIVIDKSLYKYYRYDEVSDWRDIKSLSFAQDRLDALDKEGDIYSTRDTDPAFNYIINQLKSYTNLSAISTDYDNYILLSKTGNVYTYSAKHNDALDLFKNDISAWKNVVDVVTGQLRIAALKSNGKVYVCDYNKYLNPVYDYLYDEIADWTDIVTISAGSVGSIVGLKSDGTVVATGSNTQRQLEVSGWRDIVAIAAGDWISVGLKSDGTLIIAGKTEEGVTMPDVASINRLYVPTVKY